MRSSGGGHHEVLTVLERLGADAAQLVTAADEQAWSLLPEGRITALEALAVVRRVLDAAHLGLVRSLSEPDAGELGATSTAALVSWRLRVPQGRASADVAAARATEPGRGELQEVGAALAAGEASIGHVDVAVRTLERLPTPVRREHAGAIDAFLADQSRTFRPRECEHLARAVLDRVDPDRGERGYDPEAFSRRALTLTPDRTGMVLVRGQLDPVTGAQFTAAIDHFAAPDPATLVPAADGQGQVLVRDVRTAAQRRADGLGVLARQGLAGAGTRGGETPRITVHATTEQIQALVEDPAGGGDGTSAGTSTGAGSGAGAGSATCAQLGTLTAGTLRRLACDALLERVLLAPSGAVLDLGRAVRTATPAQHRALEARDGGCVIPACTRPAPQCEVHHVNFWRYGGRTNIGELVLACGPHHSAIEAGVWDVRMVEGVPQVRPPSWVDPERRWLPGAWRAAKTAAAALGEQLTITLGEAALPNAAADARQPDDGPEQGAEERSGAPPPGGAADDSTGNADAA